MTLRNAERQRTAQLESPLRVLQREGKADATA